MKTTEYDVVIIGAGPVGLMCAFLGRTCGLKTMIIDKSDAPLKVGRADALNARTLQYLKIAGLFDEIYPIGKTCNTSSVWKNGQFISRKSSWWEDLEGCLHKHFLIIGQTHIERLLDQKLKDAGCPVRRECKASTFRVSESFCETILESGEAITSKYIIGADGPRSLVRNSMDIDFKIRRPEITWAVIDGLIETDFQKVAEIIVFQSETSDVAWIPREGDIDRFYVRMDKENFGKEEVMLKINAAIQPHRLKFSRVDWFSQFSVKESVAQEFSKHRRVFLAGDACHIHSVNGGQGLNTGLADAFNLIWKINEVEKGGKTLDFLKSYEQERKPIAESVIESSGELVRATKYGSEGKHAETYVKLVEKRAGNITGMGISYPGSGLVGKRLHDFVLRKADASLSLYSLLDYSKYTLLIFGTSNIAATNLKDMNRITIYKERSDTSYWSKDSPYEDTMLLVRPDGYIEQVTYLEPSSNGKKSFHARGLARKKNRSIRHPLI